MLGFHILSDYPDAGGTVLYTVTPQIESWLFAADTHGDAECTLTGPLLSAAQRSALYDRSGTPVLCAVDGAEVVYAGRLVEPALTTASMQLVARGPWAGLDDTRYTALWSDTSVAGWRILTNAEASARREAAFVFDTNNRLFIAPKNGLTYGGSGAANVIGALAYLAPAGGSRVITRVTGSYAVTAFSANWRLRIVEWSAAPAGTTWTSTTNTTIITGSGTGSIAHTCAANCVAVSFEWFDTATGTTVYTGEDGAHPAIITNLRVMTQTAPIRASDILTDLATVTNALNSTQLRSSTTRIVSSSLDLTSEIYEDANPQDIADSLAAKENWRVWVDRQRFLGYAPRGTGGRTWYVDAADITISRALQDVANQRYGVYQEPSNRALRTAVATNTASVARYGITRRRPVEADTTSSATATTIRDTALADSADPPPRFRFTIARLTDAGGAPVPLWRCDAEDTIIVHNLPPTLSTTIDQIRVIRVARRQVSGDATGAVLAIEPRMPTPTLETLLLRREARR